MRDVKRDLGVVLFLGKFPGRLAPLPGQRLLSKIERKAVIANDTKPQKMNVQVQITRSNFCQRPGRKILLNGHSLCGGACVTAVPVIVDAFLCADVRASTDIQSNQGVQTLHQPIMTTWHSEIDISVGPGHFYVRPNYLCYIPTPPCRPIHAFLPHLNFRTVRTEPAPTPFTVTPKL